MDTMLTVGVEGAVPLAAERWSQPPPSEVVAVAVQSIVPAPAFLIGTDCAAGFAPPVGSKKLTPPGMSSKNVVVAGLTLNVTGTTIDGLPALACKIISAV